MSATRRPPRSRRRRLRGHSLLEAMLAGSILLLGLGAVVSALSGGQSVQTHTQRVNAAVLVGERCLERLLLLPAGHSELSSTSTHTGSTYGVTGALDVDGPFTPSLDVSTGPVDGTVRIDLKVTWTERTQSRTIALVTFR